MCALHGAANTGSLIGTWTQITTYTFRMSDLPKLDLDIDRGTDFQAWHQQWFTYSSLASVESQLQDKYRLFNCFSRETLNIVDNLGLTIVQKKDQAEIVAAFKLYVDGRINQTIERRNLRLHTQHDFLVLLRELAKMCNFCNNDCFQKALRDQIIESLQSKNSCK